MKWERVKVNESRILTRKREGENEKERVIFALKKRGYQKERECKKRDPTRRSRRNNERVSGHKSYPGRSAESCFHSKSGQT